MTESKYKVAAKLSLSLFDGWQKYNYDPQYYKGMVSAIKEIIYSCPEIHSGYVSETAKDYLSKHVCKEHFYSRTQSAKKIINYMETGILNEAKLERFENFLKSRSRVHYVTSEENRNLIKYQYDEALVHWKHQYDAAGVKLVKWDKNPNKYKYCIDGIEYMSPTEIAAKYNIATSTVTKRCLSPNFTTWERIELD